MRDRHFNTIDLNTYGPGTNGDGLLSIGLQPGATFDNSNYRAEVAGALNTGFMKHQLLIGASQNIRDAVQHHQRERPTVRARRQLRRA